MATEVIKSDTEVEKPTPLVYADKISGFALGVQVSKLTFSVEIDKGNERPVLTVALPTLGLIEAMEFILTSLNQNKDMQDALLKGIEVLKDKLVTQRA